MIYILDFVLFYGLAISMSALIVLFIMLFVQFTSGENEEFIGIHEQQERDWMNK